MVQSIVSLGVNTRMYFVTGVGRPVCERVNSNLGHGAIAEMPDDFTALTVAMSAPQKIRCIPTFKGGAFFVRV